MLTRSMMRKCTNKVHRHSTCLSERCYFVKDQLVYDFGEGIIVHIDKIDNAARVGTELCPILHERFEDVELDIAKGKSFLSKNPDICVATLECGHRFSLLGIMYQFVLISMKCPLCRDGVDKCCGINHIPHSWRKCMSLKKKAMISEDRDELERMNTEVAQELQDSILSTLAEDGRVNMTVYMFVTNTESGAQRTIIFQNYELIRQQGGMLFVLSSSETSNIINSIRDTISESIRVTIHYRNTGGIPIELANTPVIPISSLRVGTEDLVFDMLHSCVRFVMNAYDGLMGIEWESQ
jgi:hypothetical protein